MECTEVVDIKWNQEVSQNNYSTGCGVYIWKKKQDQVSHWGLKITTPRDVECTAINSTVIDEILAFLVLEKPFIFAFFLKSSQMVYVFQNATL